jgi:hypothetical protein
MPRRGGSFAVSPVARIGTRPVLGLDLTACHVSNGHSESERRHPLPMDEIGQVLVADAEVAGYLLAAALAAIDPCGKFHAANVVHPENNVKHPVAFVKQLVYIEAMQTQMPARFSEEPRQSAEEQARWAEYGRLTAWRNRVAELAAEIERGYGLAIPSAVADACDALDRAADALGKRCGHLEDGE